MENLKADILEFFKDLGFKEDGHKYTLDTLTLKFSVSGLIKKYKYPTNWKKVLKESAEKQGLTEKEVSEGWDKAAKIGCDIGNKAHSFGELYPFNRDIEPKTGFDKAIQKFWNDLPDYIVPFLLEVKMYHKGFLFAGTADILLYNTRTGKIIIGDYKTNKDLFKNYKGQKMQGPFSHLLCCPFNHYQLQLSFYQILLEQIPGIEVAGRKLIWLKPNGDYLLYNLDDYTEVLKKELEVNKF